MEEGSDRKALIAQSMPANSPRCAHGCVWRACARGLRAVVVRSAPATGARVRRSGTRLRPAIQPSSSAKTRPRVVRIKGAQRTTISRAVNARKARLIGRRTNTGGSPCEITKARRRFSSISGPRMKPSRSGAGSQVSPMCPLPRSFGSSRSCPRCRPSLRC